MGRLHLDASFLIRALAPNSGEARTLRRWLAEGRAVAMSALAWGEFLCGPLVAKDEADAHRIVRVWLPVREIEAAEAARLFNQTGRRRGTFPDCIVAATAIRAGAPLATTDKADFARFQPLGLQIIDR